MLNILHGSGSELLKANYTCMICVRITNSWTFYFWSDFLSALFVDAVKAFLFALKKIQVKSLGYKFISWVRLLTLLWQTFCAWLFPIATVSTCVLRLTSSWPNLTNIFQLFNSQARRLFMERLTSFWRTEKFIILVRNVKINFIFLCAETAYSDHFLDWFCNASVFLF